MAGWVFTAFQFQVLLAAACQREWDYDQWQVRMNSVPVAAVSKASYPPALSENESILSRSFASKSVDEWSYYYTHGDHIAGRNKSMAEWTARKWADSGFETSLAEYLVYLNYPVSASLSLSRPNRTTFHAKLEEDAVQQDETTSYPNSVPAFHGYSASGNVSAEYVYVG